MPSHTTSNSCVIQETVALRSGVLGVNSYGGGRWTAALGVILHFVIALGAACF
jgi:hypothetical protein